MDIGSVGAISSGSSVVGQYAARLERKVLDIQQSQAEQLVRLVGQGQGVGQNVDVQG